VGEGFRWVPVRGEESRDDAGRGACVVSDVPEQVQVNGAAQSVEEGCYLIFVFRFLCRYKTEALRKGFQVVVVQGNVGVVKYRVVQVNSVGVDSFRHSRCCASIGSGSGTSRV